MRIRSTLLLAVALLAASVVLTGCGVSSGLIIGWRGSDTHRRKTARYVTFSGVERKAFRVVAGQTVQLEYDIEVEKGTLRLSLIDPDGETIWSKTLEEEDAARIDIGASQGGCYKLRIEGEGVGGSHDVSWDVVGESFEATGRQPDVPPHTWARQRAVQGCAGREAGDMRGLPNDPRGSIVVLARPWRNLSGFGAY